MLLGSHGVGEHVCDRCLIDPGSRRQPQRDRMKVTERPDAVVVKRPTGERRHELPKSCLIVRELKKQPALHWIVDKRGHDRRDRPWAIAF